MTAASPRTVVITGASAGIGRAAARAFATRGDRIALLARGEAGLPAPPTTSRPPAASRCASPPMSPNTPRLTPPPAQVEQTYGPIDVWVNVAFTSVFAPFTEITPEEFRRVTEVSYLGFVHGTMAALARMRSRDAGTIVQVGSALGARAIPLQSAYCGAKHAINGFTESVRTELMHERSNIHITVVQMPALNTPSSPGCCRGCRAIPSPCRRSINPKSPLAPSCVPPTTPTASSTGWAPAPPPPSWDSARCRPCWIAIWPRPAMPRSRPASVSRVTVPAICGNRWMTATAPTMAPTAPLTPGR